MLTEENIEFLQSESDKGNAAAMIRLGIMCCGSPHSAYLQYEGAAEVLSKIKDIEKGLTLIEDGLEIMGSEDLFNDHFEYSELATAYSTITHDRMQAGSWPYTRITFFDAIAKKVNFVERALFHLRAGRHGYEESSTEKAISIYEGMLDAAIKEAEAWGNRE